MGPACMSEAAAATFHQECFGWRAASRAWKSAECTSTFWPRSACSPSPRGRMPVMIREKRRWSGRWCRVIWLMSVISYRIASEITGCGLEEEREREMRKKANAEGEKWIHVWPARKIYPFMPKKNELSLHGQNEKKKRKKNRGENAEEKENCSLFRVGEKCIYNKKKIYILKCSKKKRCKKKNEETWSFAYGRPPESLASAEDNWITPLWSLYISA